MEYNFGTAKRKRRTSTSTKYRAIKCGGCLYCPILRFLARVLLLFPSERRIGVLLMRWGYFIFSHSFKSKRDNPLLSKVISCCLVRFASEESPVKLSGVNLALDRWGRARARQRLCGSWEVCLQLLKLSGWLRSCEVARIEAEVLNRSFRSGERILEPQGESQKRREGKSLLFRTLNLSETSVQISSFLTLQGLRRRKVESVGLRWGKLSILFQAVQCVEIFGWQRARNSE
jgi:hypothetical protein